LSSRLQPAKAIATALGAVAGGLIVGTFPPYPAWLWGLFGGVSGGGVGLLAAHLAGLPGRPPVLRLGLALLVTLAGFGVLFLVAGYGYVTSPRNWDIRPPG
jgi:hypothetical protein